MYRLKLLLIDLLFFGASPFVALLLRENFESNSKRLDDLTVYAATLVATAAVVLVAMGLNRGVWRFTSYAETPRLLAAVTISLLLALFITFGINRLSGVSRSLPLIQWFLVVAGMLAVRMGARWQMLQRRRRAHEKSAPPKAATGRSVLVIGMNEIASLYMRAAGEYAAGSIRIAGILAKQERHRGRLVHQHQVLGTYEQLKSVLEQLEVHGVFIDRLVVAEPRGNLAPGVYAILRELESKRGIETDFIVDSLGLTSTTSTAALPWVALAALDYVREVENNASAGDRVSPMGSYELPKRVLDVLGAAILLMLCLPLLVIVCVAVAVDVGLPLMFWQQRRGLNGRPFRMWKFRTMLPAYEPDGGRLPDAKRVTVIGSVLRRLRMDELPQLFSVIAGDMSFIGPRPLLPIDQPAYDHARFRIRPGLTGWAQIHGGRNVSVEERAALDAWYVRHASPTVDLAILVGTVRMLVAGDRRDEAVIAQALADVSRGAGKPDTAFHAAEAMPSAARAAGIG